MTIRPQVKTKRIGKTADDIFVPHVSTEATVPRSVDAGLCLAH